MKQVVVENSILNSVFEEPSQHFRFDEEGITIEIVKAQRVSPFFILIAKPKTQDKQLQMELELDGEWMGNRVKENGFIAPAYEVSSNSRSISDDTD